MDPNPSYMYILKCADDTTYVGSTKDLERRVWEHNDGEGTAYTRRRRPVRLVYYEMFASVEEAFAREKQIQGWSRAKRDALIEGRTDELKANMSTTWAKLRAQQRADRAKRRPTT